jgi:photosystem I subunit 8
MAAAFLPSILVPIVGLIFPAVSMALFFLYIQTDDIA